MKVYLLRKMKTDNLVDAIVVGNTSKAKLNGMIRELKSQSQGEIDVKDLVRVLEENGLRIMWLSVRERNRFDGVVHW